MSDTDVDMFLQTLKQLITSSKLNSIINKKDLLEFLEEDIRYLRGFLKATEKIRNTHSDLKNLVMQIWDVVFEVENTVDLFVIDCKVDKPSFFDLIVDKPSIDLKRVRMRISSLRTMVKQFYEENRWDICGVVAVNELNHSSIGSEGSNITSTPGKEKVVVGFEEEVKGVMAKLHDQIEGRPLEVITILGPGGGGKTTLAEEVYHHPLSRHTFEIRAWVNVSQDYNCTMKRNLLISILKSASPNNHTDYKGKSEDQLGEDVYRCLRGSKYLIVLDDIWNLDIWNDMQRSFPKDCKGSKILFTSRLVVQPDNINCITHRLGSLTKTCSWELLQKKVFGVECCPWELVGTGQSIAEKCEGLPLAIVIIAGILARKDRTPDVWEEVANHLSSLIAENEEGCMKILELSYHFLPPYLKACYMYIGAFSEDYEINKRELIWLWIAEGFILPSDGGKSLEAIANDYLIDLVDRNLIMIARKKCSGEIKACRIHDLLRQLCWRKAYEENFFVKINEDGSFSPSDTDKCCRRLIGSQFFREGLSLPTARNLRSLLCLCSRNCSISSEILRGSWLAEEFKLLRVLSMNSIRFSKLIRIERLVHLRYLAFQRADEQWLKEPFIYPLNLEIINLHDGGAIIP